MTGNQYDFIEFLKTIEIRNDSHPDEEIFSAWIPFSYLEEFVKIVGSEYFIDDSPEANLGDDCVYINLVDILEYLEIESEVILKMLEGEK